MFEIMLYEIKCMKIRGSFIDIWKCWQDFCISRTYDNLYSKNSNILKLFFEIFENFFWFDNVVMPKQRFSIKIAKHLVIWFQKSTLNDLNGTCDNMLWLPF